jgi:alkylation response protein AidB-like acyl-CoA dehydrogenase
VSAFILPVCWRKIVKEYLTMPVQPCVQAEAFEQALGDPLDPGGLFSFARSVELDEREEFPTTLCALVEAWGLQDYYVPVQYGGKLQRIDELLMLMRVLSRRDLSVAIAHTKTLLGSLPLWIAGSEEQRLDLARRVLGREYVALALTEEAHGADLAASDCFARKIHGHYLLSGSKWLVNNATRGSVLCLLARTHPRGGPLGTSLFYIEKELLDARAWTLLPKIKTHGIRGIDISGIQFEHAALSEQALIGKEHHGLEPVFKTFQVTRTLCAALALGAADTALRLALRFACERRLYQSTVFAIPAARATLVGAFADLLTCDCVTLLATRALQAAPEQMSLWSAVTKYCVPTSLEGVVREAATVLGARHYLREHYAWGMFQKVMRDIAIVGLFDGSSQVNLSLIAGQLGRLAQSSESLQASEVAETRACLQRICTPEQELPVFAAERLTLGNRSCDYLQVGLLLAEEQFEEQVASRGLSAALRADLRRLITRLAQERRALDQRVRDLVNSQQDLRTSPTGFALARRHCVLHAAAACYYLWLWQGPAWDQTPARDAWVLLCLSRLLHQLFPCEDLIDSAAYTEEVCALFVQQAQEHRLFGMMPLQLAGRPVVPPLREEQV